jgi:hypothetical protein
MPYKLKSDRGPKQEDPDDAAARFHQLVKSVDAPASGSCLKTLLVWALPSVVVPLILWLFLVTLRSMPLGIFMALGFVLWMGAIHATNTSPIPGVEEKPKWPSLIFYMVIQLILMPLFWVTLLCGVCAYSGGGSF